MGTEGKPQKSQKSVRFSVATEDTCRTLSALGEERRTPVSMAKRKAPTPLEQMVEIQSHAEYLLRSVIVNERARRWEKVVNIYNALLKLISRRNLPQGFSLTDSYVLLIYESYYHLGLALQNLQRHREAVAAYTQAIKAVNIHKNGCLAGCNSNTCFQTPVLAKRAFSHAKLNDMKKAFIDIEKAVVLDTRNSDLYCIRALLWNTTKDTEKAVDDLNRALRYNPCHVCALLLRGSIDQPFRITFNFLEGLSLQSNQKTMKKDHIKAQQINQQAVKFLDVTDIHSPKLIQLWNRFLWSLNVPRNIVYPQLMEGFNVGRNEMSSKNSYRPRIERSRSTPTIHINGKITDESLNQFKENDDPEIRPFRCGTPNMQRDSIYSKRAKSYGDAVRTYTTVLQASRTQEMTLKPSRPPTALSTSSNRVKSSSHVPSTHSLRPPSTSSTKRPSVSFSQPLLTIPSRRIGTVSAPPTLIQSTSRRSSMTVQTANQRVPSAATLPVPTRPVTRASSVRSARDNLRQQKRSVSEFVQKVHGMRVFVPINVTDAPRMYYKPWSGDKLPVGKISRVTE